MSAEGYGLSFAGKCAATREIQTDPAGRLVAEPDWERPTRPRHTFVTADNLQALKLLRPGYAGHIDCIYIDPPYNTGHDFVYRDRWAQTTDAYLTDSGQRDREGNMLVANPATSGRYHSAWLSMMLPRLHVARELLADTGVLFVSIDDHEVANLRLLLDEVFGADCFIAQIVVVSNRGGRDYLRIATSHEYILCYGKSADAPLGELARPAAANAHHDRQGVYELRELRNRNPKFTPANRPNLAYPIYVDPEIRDEANGTCAVCLSPSPGSVEVIPRSKTGAGSVWRWGRPKLEAALHPSDPAASDVVARAVRGGGWRVFEKSRKSTTKARSVWDDPILRSEQGTKTLRALMGAAVFDHPKPVELVARCLQLGMPTDGLALDFFAGSGTTAHAAAWLNAKDGGHRRTVSITLDEAVPKDSIAAQHGFETIAAIARARIERALPSPQDLRSFRVVPDATGPDATGQPCPWHTALAGGAMLGATPARLATDAWLFDTGDGHGHVVFLGDTLAREAVQRWALPAMTRITCRAEALDDALTLYLARRFVLCRV